MMDQCKQTYMFLISFTLGGESGIAIVSALDERQAVQVLKSSGKGNCCPKSYTIRQTRNLGLTTTGFGLLMESYVDAMVAYDAIVNALNNYGRGGSSIHTNGGCDCDIELEEIGDATFLIVEPSNYYTKEEADARFGGGGGGGGSITVDSEISSTSTNPVQNRVIKIALDAKYTKPQNGISKTDLAQGVQTSLNRADSALQSFTETDPTVPSWAKQSSKPTYTAQEVGALPVSTPIPSDLDDLSDVDGTTPTNGQVLAWNATSSKWKPTTMQGGGSVTVDSALSDTSENPVQNKVVKAAIDAKQDVIDSTHKLPYALISDTPTIPVVPTNVSAFTNDAGYLTSQGIIGKADKVSSPTSGNFAGLDANGNLTDSGSKASDFATAAQGAKADTAYQKPSGGIPSTDLAAGVIPVVPTALSSFTDDLGSSPTHTHSQYLTAQDISGKQDKSTITSSSDATGNITIADNIEFRFTNVALTSLTIALPASIGDRLDTWISFNSGSTATSATYPNTIKWSGDDVNNNVFVPAASKTYNIGIWYDGINVNAVARSV